MDQTSPKFVAGYITVSYNSFEVAYPVVVRLVWQSVHVYRAIAGTVESRLEHIEGGDILLL